MTESDSLELLVKIQAKGQDALANLTNTTRQLEQQDKAATAASQAYSKSLEDTGKAAQRADVGIGTLLDSARRASSELKAIAEANAANVRNLERQAQMSGARGSQGQLNLQRQFAVQDYGKTAEDVKRINDAFDQMDKNVRPANESLSVSILRAQLLSSALMGAAGAIKTYTVEAAQYAARTDQVAAITDNLARVNGMNVKAVRMEADAVRDLGITTQESRNAINLMIGSQMDLSKATDLTRLAQNAAKVAGISSSDALQRLVYAISSAQPEMLRTLGIQVSFENAYSRGAAAMGKSTTALTEQEKVTIRTNAVLARSPLIDGSYVMSLTTAAGQMQSMSRYSDELKNALGMGLQPALQDVIHWMRDLNKYALENADSFQKTASGVTALSIAGAAFAATPFLPLPARAGVAGAAGVAAYALGTQDPIQAKYESANDAVKSLEHQRDLLKKQLDLGIIDEPTFKRFSDSLPKYRELLKGQFAEAAADIFKQRQAKLKGMNPYSAGEVGRTLLGDLGGVLPGGYADAERAARIPDKYNIGNMTVTKADIESAMNGTYKFDKSGLVASNPLMTPAPVVDKGAAKAARDKAKQIDTLVDNLSENGLDPLAHLLKDTQNKLQDLVEKYGKLTAADTAKITANLDVAIIRQAAKRKVAPIETDQQAAYFQYGGLRPPNPQNVEVDPARNAQAVATVRERSLAAMQRSVAYQEQMIRLTAGPGGEVAAINKIADLRISAAGNALKLETDVLKQVEARARYEAEVDQARKDRMVQLAQLQQQQLEQVRNTAGSVFDAMMSKGVSGIGDVIKAQLAVVGRTVFQNIAVEIFNQMKDKLKTGNIIGGQVDPKTGKLTGLGRVLQNTPLGVDQTQMAMQANTTETRDNTAATKELTGAIRDNWGGSGGSGGGSGGGWLSGGDDSVTPSGGMGKLGKILGTAAAMGAGAYATVQGVRQGGAKGALTATAGVAGMAGSAITAGLLGAGLAAGPVGPILAGAALGITALTSLFGKSREKFDQEQTDALKRNAYTEPTATNRTTDVRGGDVDYDFTGRLRSAYDRQTVITFQVSAMDAKSFLDRSGDIAEALHKELRLGNRVGLDIQQAVLGA